MEENQRGVYLYFLFHGCRNVVRIYNMYKMHLLIDKFMKNK